MSRVKRTSWGGAPSIRWDGAPKIGIQARLSSEVHREPQYPRSRNPLPEVPSAPLYSEVGGSHPSVTDLETLFLVPSTGGMFPSLWGTALWVSGNVSVSPESLLPHLRCCLPPSGGKRWKDTNLERFTGLNAGSLRLWGRNWTLPSLPRKRFGVRVLADEIRPQSRPAQSEPLPETL